MNILKLIKYLSNQVFQYKDIDLINNSEIKNKSDVEKSLIDIENIENNYCNNKSDTVKFLYSNRFSIHNIIYKLDIIIRINFKDKKEENLSYYFYLSLLIRDNDDIVNYSYPIEFIKEIVNQTKKDNDKYYKIIIISKIII